MSDDTVQISAQEVLQIKEYAEHNCGVELILEQAEIICLSLNNKQRYPEGWNESDLANELQHRYAD
jgi:hypothetical protein